MPVGRCTFEGNVRLTPGSPAWGTIGAPRCAGSGARSVGWADEAYLLQASSLSASYVPVLSANLRPAHLHQRHPIVLGVPSRLAMRDGLPDDLLLGLDEPEGFRQNRRWIRRRRARRRSAHSGRLDQASRRSRPAQAIHRCGRPAYGNGPDRCGSLEGRPQIRRRQLSPDAADDAWLGRLARKDDRPIYIIAINVIS